jgi:hypothetical protein
VSQFKGWPKTPRLNRNCIATEKIDGTNSAVIIERCTVPEGEPHGDFTHDAVAVVMLPNGEEYALYAQSRKRLLTPGKSTDNFGFAAWVRENAPELAAGLGEGYHYGEWWGGRIQRGYGLEEKRFSLFNPVLATGTNITAVAESALTMLRENGSFAAPGFNDPEGIVVYHTAARQTFKVTLENDEAAKGTFKGMHATPEAAA